jgi:hypothetical protein
MKLPCRATCLILLLVLPGCGQELMAGGYNGQVEATVVDDGSPAAAPSANRVVEGRRSTALPQFPGSEIQGTVEVDATVTLIDALGGRRDLAQVAPRVAVRIASSDSASLARDSLLVGAYDRVLITFTRVEVEVVSGLQLLGGLQITGRVRVPLDGAPLTVEAAIPLVVRRDRKHQLIIDLNAADWLVHASAAGVVPAATFASHVRVRVR